MEYIEHYDDEKQRESLCDIANNKGYRMLHDNFDSDWKRGDEIHGTLTFTDVQAPQAEPTRDLANEVDELKAKVASLEAKLK